DQPVVLFVTGELVDRWIDPREEAVDRPRPGPRRGIADRELVSECFRTGERVALDEMHAISRSAPVSIRTEIGGLDDQAFPPPRCRAHPPATGRLPSEGAGVHPTE